MKVSGAVPGGTPCGRQSLEVSRDWPGSRFAKQQDMKTALLFVAFATVGLAGCGGSVENHQPVDLNPPNETCNGDSGACPDTTPYDAGPVSTCPCPADDPVCNCPVETGCGCPADDPNCSCVIEIDAGPPACSCPEEDPSCICAADAGVDAGPPSAAAVLCTDTGGRVVDTFCSANPPFGQYTCASGENGAICDPGPDASATTPECLCPGEATECFDPVKGCVSTEP